MGGQHTLNIFVLQIVKCKYIYIFLCFSFLFFFFSFEICLRCIFIFVCVLWKGMFGPDVGVWRIVLNPQPAGGPNTITILCTTTEGVSQTIQLKDVLFGDVWVCSGQSNMQFTVKQVHWATPFKIHTPPVEDFGYVYLGGGVNFQMKLPSLWFIE